MIIKKKTIIHILFGCVKGECAFPDDGYTTMHRICSNRGINWQVHGYTGNLYIEKNIFILAI